MRGVLAYAIGIDLATSRIRMGLMCHAFTVQADTITQVCNRRENSF